MPDGSDRGWRDVLCLLALAAAPAACTPAESDSLAPTVPLPSTALGEELAALVAKHVERVRAAPEDARRHGTLGLVYEANNHWAEARLSYEKAVQSDPDDPVWRCHLAAALQEVGDEQAALAVLLEGAARAPEHAPLQHRLGTALLEHGRTEEATAAFERTVLLAPGAYDGHAGLGAARLAAGDVPGAHAALERALEIRPGARSARYQYGLALRAEGRLEEAERELARGAGGRARSMPDEGTARMVRYAVGLEHQRALASRLLRTDRPEEALELLERLRARAPDDARLAIDLGVAESRLGRPRRALAAFLEAERLEPDSHVVQVNLAATQLDLGQPEAALTRARRGIELAPEEAQAHLLAGRALQVLGRADEARRALERASDLAPSSAAVQAALAELEGTPETTADRRP